MDTNKMFYIKDIVGLEKQDIKLIEKVVRITEIEQDNDAFKTLTALFKKYEKQPKYLFIAAFFSGVLTGRDIEQKIMYGEYSIREEPERKEIG